MKKIALCVITIFSLFSCSTSKSEIVTSEKTTSKSVTEKSSVSGNNSSGDDIMI